MWVAVGYKKNLKHFVTQSVQTKRKHFCTCEKLDKTRGKHKKYCIFTTPCHNPPRPPPPHLKNHHKTTIFPLKLIFSTTESSFQPAIMRSYRYYRTYLIYTQTFEILITSPPNKLCILNKRRTRVTKSNKHHSV